MNPEIAHFEAPVENKPAEFMLCWVDKLKNLLRSLFSKICESKEF